MFLLSAKGHNTDVADGVVNMQVKTGVAWAAVTTESMAWSSPRPWFEQNILTA